MKPLLTFLVVIFLIFRANGQAAFSPKEYADKLMNCYCTLDLYTHLNFSEECLESLRQHVATAADFLQARLGWDRKTVIAMVGTKDEKELSNFLTGCTIHMQMPPANAEEMSSLRIWTVLFKSVITRVYVKLEKP